ncbi:MAG: AN1-type zinc finger domain-containing protein [Candidatus Thorarchaeota archaeon]
MARCSLCGQEDLCFTCPYCNGVYCADHRLPEGHGCPGLHLAKEKAQQRVSDSLESDSFDASEDFFDRRQRQTIQRKRTRSRRKRFSAQERKDLSISIVLVILVSLSLQTRLVVYSFIPILGVIQALQYFIISGYGWVPVAYIGIFLTAYLVHEFAHKFTAQSFGMWAEFRMTMQGYYLSAIAILFAIPIFGTGTVFTSGAKSMDEEGKVNLAGPLSNFIFSTILVSLSILIPLVGIEFILPVYFVLQGGTILNSFLGLFNMIPIQPFDGGTIYRWNRMIWAVLTFALIFTLIFGYLVMPTIYVMFS